MQKRDTNISQERKYKKKQQKKVSPLPKLVFSDSNSSSMETFNPAKCSGFPGITSFCWIVAVHPSIFPMAFCKTRALAKSSSAEIVLVLAPIIEDVEQKRSSKRITKRDAILRKFRFMYKILLMEDF